MSSSSSLSLLILLLSITNSLTIYRDEDCPRIRKPFHTLTEDERMLYVTGYQALRKNGKLEIISSTHAANVAVHKGSSFFFFHAYMIWEAETAIRELGGEYSCFSMPYWDYTIDSGLEHDPTIFHLNVGENGDPRNSFCMDDELWGNIENYWSTDADTCGNKEQRLPQPFCCLKRSVSDSQLLPNVMQIASVYLKNSNFLMFETQIDHYHVWPHFYLAVNTWSQMATAYAVDDPIFFLLHTFTLYQRALWTSCYEYDNLDSSELHLHKDAYTPSCNPNMIDCGVVGIDASYNLYPMNQFSWSLASKMDITPRMLYNIKDWNVQYDLGTFYKRSKLNEWCEIKAKHGDINGPNPEWFVSLTVDWNENEKERDNHLQNFIDDKWNQIKSKQDELQMSDEEIYYAVESLSCKYHRLSSENSCFQQEFDEYETCQSLNIFDKDAINLDDMLSFDGVNNNKCLQKRRKQLYSVSNLDDSIKLKLCNGEYDYKCPEWVHPSLLNEDGDNDEKIKQLFTINKPKLVSSYDNNGYNYMILISICVFCIISFCFVIKHWFISQENDKIPTHNVSQPEDVEYGTF